MKRVSFTTTGHFVAPAATLGRGLRGRVTLATVVAVCERDDGSITLVDAGWSAGTCADPRRSLGWLHTAALGVRVGPGDDIASQLRGARLDPARVSAVVATHLHLDHVGGVADLPNAELVTTLDEFRAARANGLRPGYRREDLDAARRLRPVELKHEPRLGFGRSLALDDEVALLDARGHTAGHVAVLVRGVSGWWLHAGDAAYGIGEIEGRGASPLAWVLAWSRRLLSETHATLRATRAAATGPRLVLSHDSEAFALLPKLARGGGDGPGSTEVRSRDLSP